ncbi:Protein takeout [Frankliniella fusca]|uniref:Protein takeout n=1 Tax=Frankliniella fusca TaxID=407009 RepID=A0AAE1H160_9NEOP|nr:Protein takeout [Frankliniella fusca]
MTSPGTALAAGAPALVLVLVALGSAAVRADLSAKDFGAGLGRPLPSFLKICKRHDPNLNECIKEAVEQLRPHLTEGILELGIPSCEPLLIPEVVVNQGSGAVTVTSVYRNLRVYGPSQFVLKNIKVDLEKNRVRVRLFLPKLSMDSDYFLQGRILMLPIQGHGHSSGNYTNIEATATMTGQRVIRGGREYMDVKEFLVDFQIGHASVHLGNLFDGDQELGEIMNKFLNENWRSVAREVQPILEDTIAELFKTFANKIYHMYPLDVLLPE